MYKHAADFLRERIKDAPETGIVLGSGLGVLAELIENPIIIDYEDIPGFKRSTVEGHKGRFVIGKYSGKSIIAMQGRFHFYEGYGFDDIVLPVRVMKLLGANNLIITNAAGGINPSFKPGDLMLIKDHINMAGIQTLRGLNKDDLGTRFPDMSNAYDDELIKAVCSKAAGEGISLRTGVYAMMSGPCYETPAEIKMLKIIGADAVGMSTVPEVTAAVHAGMRVLGISCITNMAAGILDKKLSHDEVMETAKKAQKTFVELITLCVNII